MLMLFSCQKEGQIAEAISADNDVTTVEIDSANTSGTADLNQINLETFGFPAEVNGCSCYFAKNKEDFEDEKYVYIDDYGNNAFLKIDGKSVKIKNFNKVIKNDDITVTIQGKKVSELEEVMMFEGTMTVENKKGEKTITPIYGECGC